MDIITPIFAEAASNNSDIITWGIILTLSTIAANIATIFATRRAQKREVSFGFVPASKEEFDDHVGDTREKFKQLHDERQTDLRLAAQGRKGIHDKIDVVAGKVSGLDATTMIQNQTLARMDSKLDRINERMSER
jgi:hypothetical protein